MSVTPYYIDTGTAIHRPQTDKIRGRKYASSVHGYRGRVLTRREALAADAPLCDRCFPQGFNPHADPPSSIGPRAARMRAAGPVAVTQLDQAGGNAGK